MRVAKQRYRRRQIAELKQHPKNPRRGNVDAIRESIAKNDFVGAVLVQRSTDYVLAGNHRLQAAEAEGATELPVLEVDVDDETALRILLADNRASDLATYDDTELVELLRGLGQDAGTLEGTGWGFDDFRALEREVAALTHADVSDDEPAAPPKKPRSKRGEVYELGSHRLYCGDATNAGDAERLMIGETAALLFTSPPYLDARDYGGGDLSLAKLTRFIGVFADRAELLAVNLGLIRRNGELVTYWDAYLEAARDARLKLLAWNIWDRGQPWSVAQNMAMFPLEHEWVFVFGGAGKALNLTVPNKGPGLRTGITNRQPDGSLKRARPKKVRTHRALGSIFRSPPALGGTGASGDHPARFPIAFPLAYIEAATDRGEVVVDPFAGSGSTLIAAEQAGRRCFAMEIDPGYCDVIRDRYEAFVAREQAA